MNPCTSKSHRQYAEAIESLWIHSRLAQRDLNTLMEKVAVNPDRTQGEHLLHEQHKLVDIEERLAFGRQQLADAQAVVDRHLANGKCRNLQAVAS